MKKIILVFVAGLACFNLVAQKSQRVPKTENVILITLDGMRWQDVFNGADYSLMKNGSLVDDTVDIKKKFWATTPEDLRRRAAADGRSRRDPRRSEADRLRQVPFARLPDG